MSDEINKQIEQTLAFVRYLSWADLMNDLFVAEMAVEAPASDVDACRKHEWRWFGLMCYWYASLQVVVEAWDQLKFTDPIIDRLLAHPKQFRKLLRRYRNAVFHYQASLMDPKFIELLEQGAAHVYWVTALHDEMMRFFAEYLSAKMVTDDQRVELRESIETVLHWYPYREAPHLDSFDRALLNGRKVLDKYPDNQSEERRELEHILESAKINFQNGRQNWAALRAQMLRDAGVE